jgi:hypothetical protein
MSLSDAFLKIRLSATLELFQGSFTIVSVNPYFADIKNMLEQSDIE